MKGTAFFWVDAFAARQFAGNPAVVCVPRGPLTDGEMQDLAREFNVSETVFVRGAGGQYAIRWFTPTVEVPLVGHATLAAAHVILTDVEPNQEALTFMSADGETVTARRDGEEIRIDLPADMTRACPPTRLLIDGLGIEPAETRIGRHHVAILSTAEQVRSIRPDFSALARLERPTIVVSAPAADCDYVLRFFAPANGVPEDAVSGVAQCSLVPYWAERTGKDELISEQLSARGGWMRCSLVGDRVAIAGPCCMVARGVLT